MALETKLQMEYRRFEIPWGAGKRELGVFGEIHHYSKKESLFARDVVKEYDVVVAEMRQPGVLLGCAGLLLLPFTYAFVFRESRTYETAMQTAHELGKEIVPIEAGYAIPLDRQAAFVGAGCLALGLFPLTLVASYLLPKKEDRSRMVKIGGLGVFMTDVHYRDEIMAYRLAEQVHKHEKPILAVVGKAHLEGLVKNLIEKQKLPLKEVSRKIIE